MSVFLVQIVSFEIVHSKMLYVETAVNSAVETAKQDGCFTSSNISGLRNKIASKVGCAPGDITVTATASPVYRGQLISYSLTYPLKNVIGAAGILGIAEADNIVMKTIQGTAASEYID